MANPNRTTGDGASPLMSAAWGCRDEVVSLLLESGANVNLKDERGYSALMYAVGAPNCIDGRIVAVLIRLGASINDASKTGRTALMGAAWAGNEVAVLELVSAGANLYARAEGGETALAMAHDRKIGRRPSHDRIAALLASIQMLVKK